MSIIIIWLCKDWELPNSRLWLPKCDVDRSLDFPIKTSVKIALSFTFDVKKLQIIKQIQNRLP